MKHARESSIRPMVGSMVWLLLAAGMLLVCGLAAPRGAQAEPPKAEKLDPAAVAADAERAKMLVEVPKSAADYTLPADQAQAGWEGMEKGREEILWTGAEGTTKFAVEKDYFGPGANSLHLERPDYGKTVYAYWKLSGIKTGKYYLALWTQTNNVEARTEYSPANLLHTLFINGWVTRFSTTSDPVQVKPGVWLTELQGKEPVELKDGDEIALAPAWGNCQFLRLGLYTKEPVRGHGVTGQSWGLREGMPLQVQLETKLEILGTGVDGQELEAKITIANPMHRTAKIDADWMLADYFGKPMVKKTEPLSIEPHKVWATSYKFKAAGEDHAYQLDLKTHAAKGSDEPGRPLEMIELNDFARLGYLPSAPGPLDVWNHTRRNIQEVRTGLRMCLPLDGDDWQVASLTTRRVPAAVPDKLPWQRTWVPYGDSRILPDGVYGRWFRKTFKVPDWMKGQRYIIDLPRIVVEGTLFVNGKQVAAKREGTDLPLVLDVTDLLKPGDNELVLCVRDAIGVVSEDYIDQYKRVDDLDSLNNEDWLTTTRFYVTLSSVYLRTAPAVRVNQALVLPKPEQGKIRVLARVENTTKQAQRVEVRVFVEQFGIQVKGDFPSKTVPLEAGQVKEVEMIGSVTGLAEYTPRHPNLAKLGIWISPGAKDGNRPARAMLDIFEQRFGYRQMKVEGTQFTWNGKPKRLLGSFQHGPEEHYQRLEGIEATRDYNVSGNFKSLDLYDEIGNMTYPSLDGTDAIGWKWLNNKRVEASSHRVAVETAWLTGSHPSVVGYDLANESFHYDPYVSGVEGQTRHGEILAGIFKLLHEKVDPDLWVFSDGDESLGDRINFCSFHYLNQGLYGTWSRIDGNGLNDPVHGYFHYAPDSFYLNGAAQEPRAGTVLHQNPDWTYGSCACGESETFWFFGANNGIFAARYLGDKAAVSTNYQFWTGRGMSWTKQSLDAYRDMDMTLICGIYWRNFLATGVQHVTFILPQQEVRYYSGARFDRRLTVVDDEFQPGKLLFTWQLLDENGRKLDGKDLSGTSTTKFLDRNRLAFDLPKVTARTAFTLTMNLTKDGRQRAYEERMIEVWPALETVKMPLKKGAIGPAAAVFDPKGELAPMLKQLGFAFTPIDALDAKSLAGSRALVIGPMAMDDTMSAASAAVREFVAGGGRVILLEQTSMMALPADTYVEHAGTFSQAFVRASDHPVMSGLNDVAFVMWNPGHRICDRVYRRPARGNFMTLVECGQDGSLIWTPLMEVYVGKGSILATQLPLTSRWKTEPMAAEMLVRMLAYLDKPIYRSPQDTLVVVNGSKEVQSRLAEIRASVSDKPDAGTTWLLDMHSPVDPARSASIKQLLENGGTLIVHRAAPKDAAWLSELIGKSVTVTVQPYQSWEDRQMLDQPGNALVAGLNNVDFYWRSLIVSEAGDGTDQISNGVQKHRFGTEYVARVEGAKDVLFPGGLAEVPAGKGRVIFDQLNWEMPETDIVGGSPRRVISMLLTNLGIAQRPPNPKPVLPDGVAFETLDISKQANTSMVDTKAGGTEDWCSWGPDADIRDMPTGKVSFTGTPFDVPKGPLNAICPRCNYIKYLKDHGPDSVTVPVGKSGVAGIWLLHTGGWSGGKASFGRREIWYSDGAKEVIDMNGDNMGDWNYGHDQFPDEEYTTTTVAWKGACKQYPMTRVYKTLWVNPHPAKRIDKIVITNAGMEEQQWRFVPHLAITLAMSRGAAAAGGDAAKAQALIAEATKLLESKQEKEAQAKLEAALAADGANTGAWALLTGLRAKTDDAKTFTSLCQKWMAADGKNPQPYNVLAAYLEGKGQKEEALKLYKRSMEIEWNQPPTGEAVRRLEKELKK